MQYAVPQFTDVEDKLIGPLTLKQFFVLLFAGGICLLFWSLPVSKVISVLIDIPIALGGIGLAFASYNGRSMLSYILPYISFSLSPKVMIFKREAVTANVVTAETKSVNQSQTKTAEAPEGRLKKLAYLLDQKTAEEKELIEKQTISNTKPITKI